MTEKTHSHIDMKTKAKEFINPTGLSYLKSSRKRAFDLIGAVVVSPVTLPLIGIAALAIKIEDKGPVIYEAKVLGQNNKEFTMYKLRSMVPNADKIRADSGEEHFNKVINDPRITKVGKWIRKLSIDELPQLLNILKGEMTLVGPRPVFADTMLYLSMIKELEQQYKEWEDYYRQVKKGCINPKLTIGRAEVTHSINGLKKGMEAEINYIKNASLLNDITWIFRGLLTIVLQKGAY